MKIANSILGCCGLSAATQGYVTSAFVCGTEEEIEQFMKLAEEQDKLFEDVKSVKFSVPIGNKQFLGHYTIADNNLISKYSGKLHEPKQLVYNKNVDNYNIIGGGFIHNDFAQFLHKARSDNTFPIIQISGFGEEEVYFKTRLAAVLPYHEKGKVLGVVFRNAKAGWVTKQIAELETNYKVLVKQYWHNPRYLLGQEDHYLCSVFFTDKEQ